MGAASSLRRIAACALSGALFGALLLLPPQPQPAHADPPGVSFAHLDERLDDALALTREGQFASAIPIFEALLADAPPSWPRHHDALIGLARAQMAAGAPKAALDAGRRLIKSYPTSPHVPEVLLIFGDALRGEGGCEHALKAYDKVQTFEG